MTIDQVILEDSIFELPPRERPMTAKSLAFRRNGTPYRPETPRSEHGVALSRTPIPTPSRTGVGKGARAQPASISAILDKSNKMSTHEKIFVDIGRKPHSLADEALHDARSCLMVDVKGLLKHLAQPCMSESTSKRVMDAVMRKISYESLEGEVLLSNVCEQPLNTLHATSTLSLILSGYLSEQRLKSTSTTNALKNPDVIQPAAPDQKPTHEEFMNEIGTFVYRKKMDSVSTPLTVNSRAPPPRQRHKFISSPRAFGSELQNATFSVEGFLQALIEERKKTLYKAPAIPIIMPRRSLMPQDATTLAGTSSPIEIPQGTKTVTFQNKEPHKSLPTSQYLAKRPMSKLHDTDLHMIFIVSRLLKKQSSDRTNEDLHIIFSVFKTLGAFQKLSQFLLMELCRVATYQKFETGRYVFRQGEVGTCWHVIYQGSVDVLVSKTGSFEDGTSVAVLHQGDGFGDLALVNDAPRGASIVTLKPTEIFAIQKTDYNRIVKACHDKEIKENVLLLRKVTLFESWTPLGLRAIAGRLLHKSVKAGTVIATEGQPLDEVYFVRSGTCTAMKDLNFPDQNKIIEVHIKELTQGHCFGDSAVVDDQASSAGVSHKSPYTISAKTNVELVFISAFEARSRFRNDILLSPPKILTPIDVTNLYLELKKRQRLKVLRDKMINEIIKEKFKDPNMTEERLRHLQKLEKRRNRERLTSAKKQRGGLIDGKN